LHNERPIIPDMLINDYLELDSVSADVTLADSTQGPLFYFLLDTVSKTVVRIWLKAPTQADLVAISVSGTVQSNGN
jgi:hypothetical protein